MRRADALRLVLAGIVLMLLQGLLVRELSAALISCELTILVVVAAYWSGVSLGYALSRRVPDRWMQPLAMGSLALHGGLTVVRLWPLLGLWLGLRGGWILAWVYLMAVPLPLLSSIVLPRYLAHRSPDALMPAYQLELLGGLVGLCLLSGFSLLSGPWIWLVYFGCVGSLTLLLVETRWLRGIVLGFVGVCLVISVPLRRWQTIQFYQYLKHVSVREVLHSSDSLYQKVELIRDAHGDMRCFLNGLEYFNTHELETFNRLLAELPAALLRPPRVLIVGSGSMSSVAHVLPYSRSVTTVEIDRRVVEVGRRYLAAFNHLDQRPEHHVIVDDAKHFLRTTSDTFDLIILDVPAPVYIQTGLLYTQEFYTLARAHLRRGGAIALYASGWFTERNPIARQVVASAAAVFPECYVISEFSQGMTIVIAGEVLSCTPQEIAQKLKAWFPEDTIWVYTRQRALADVVRRTPPLSIHHPRAILWTNVWLLEQLWNPQPITKGAIPWPRAG